MPITRLETASVGYPVTRLGVSFFPLYLTGNELPDIATDGLRIEELAQPAMPELTARNPTDKPILIVEGEELLGGDQDRCVNATALVAPMSDVRLPVSCVGPGRWGDHREYRRDVSRTPYSVRARLMESLNASRRRKGRHHSDQAVVWQAIKELQLRMDVTIPPTAAPNVTEILHRDRSRLRAIQSLVKIGPLPQQNGIVVTHGPWVEAMEVFGSPELLQTHWGGLVRSYLLEAPPDPTDTVGLSAERAMWAVRRFAFMKTSNTRGIGLGMERRAMDPLMAGQALMLKEMIVHASMFTRN